jgi:hypothetical protein
MGGLLLFRLLLLVFSSLWHVWCWNRRRRKNEGDRQPPRLSANDDHDDTISQNQLSIANSLMCFLRFNGSIVTSRMETEQADVVPGPALAAHHGILGKAELG